MLKGMLYIRDLGTLWAYGHQGKPLARHWPLVSGAIELELRQLSGPELNIIRYCSSL